VINDATQTAARIEMELTTKQHELLDAVKTRRHKPNLMSFEEFAEFLGVSVRTLRRRQALEKNPPRFWHNHGYRYPVDGVLACLEGSKHAAD
jgi:DNA-binding transcriptional regulator YiaG